MVKRVTKSTLARVKARKAEKAKEGPKPKPLELDKDAFMGNPRPKKTLPPMDPGVLPPDPDDEGIDQFADHMREAARETRNWSLLGIVVLAMIVMVAYLNWGMPDFN